MTTCQFPDAQCAEPGSEDFQFGSPNHPDVIKLCTYHMTRIRYMVTNGGKAFRGSMQYFARQNKRQAGAA